ncbi:enoyl-CoA hydratase/isomerase family protein [Mycolicibacter sinensis]|uniref:enoyl-CoA hydratase/isomerase family protein n=1 Tax=Mycolicibacter sinensis (strain JDM601) TaxID=875328 RepID=UPI000A688C51|nr:enoyl-CoA hydratase/isomerase family protein [Mycolicibacter sinensis]
MALVRLERSKGVAQLVLARPERRNALDEELIEDLTTAIAELEADGEIGCVVVRGDGPGFSSGIDASTLTRLSTPEGLRRIRSAFVAAYDRLEQLPIPTVASVHGWAIGAGFELALACDLRVVAADATLGLPETRMGVVPDVGGTGRLTSLVGAGRAKELILTSAMIDGTRAGRLGIANRVAPVTKLAAVTAALTDELLTCSRTANGLAKRIIDGSARPTWEDTLDAELDAQLHCIGTPEFSAACGRFLASPGANTPQARR